LLRWLIFVGIDLFGVGFLVGSLFAPRNPGRAGVIFLVFLAIYGVLPGLSGIAPQEASSVCVCSPHIDCCACMHAFSLDSGLSVAACALLIPVRFLVVLASAPLGARRREFIQKAVLATLRSDHRAS